MSDGPNSGPLFLLTYFERLALRLIEGKRFVSRYTGLRWTAEWANHARSRRFMVQATPQKF